MGTVLIRDGCQAGFEKRKLLICDKCLGFVQQGGGQ